MGWMLYIYRNKTVFIRPGGDYDLRSCYCREGLFQCSCQVRSIGAFASMRFTKTGVQLRIELVQGNVPLFPSMNEAAKDVNKTLDIYPGRGETE